MRIVFVVHTFFPNWWAGTEVVAKTLARNVIDRGHEAFIVCYEPPAENEWFEGIRAWDTVWDGLAVHRISFCKQHGSFHLKDYFNQEIEDLLLAYFSRIQPDVVHVVHSMHLSTASIWAAKRLGLPVVATATDFWYVCPTYQLVKWDESLCTGPQPLTCLACLTDGDAGIPLRRLAARKRLASVLSPLFTWLGSARAFRSDWLPSLLWLSARRSWLKKTISQVDVLLAQATNTARLIKLNGMKPVEFRVSVLSIEGDLQRIEKTAPRDSILRVGYTGTFRHSKGLHVLLEAMRRLPPSKVHLDVYGSPGAFPEYDQVLTGLAEGLENVTFRGMYSREKLPEIFSEFDVVVIPSLWYENSPLVLLEAFALKTPVVASNVGSLADLVHHGKSGLLFEMGNPDDLARQLQRLAEHPEQVEQLRAGIPAVRTIEDNVDELVDIYARLTRDYAGRPRIVQRPFSLPRAALWWGSVRRFFKTRTFEAQFEDRLTLIGFQASVHPNRELRLDFEWHAREICPDWVVFVHLVDENVDTRIQGDHPIFPRIQDPWGFIAYRMSIFTEPHHAGKTYRVRLGVWRPEAGVRLSVVRSRGMQMTTADWVSPGVVQMG